MTSMRLRATASEGTVRAKLLFVYKGYEQHLDRGLELASC